MKFIKLFSTLSVGRLFILALIMTVGYYMFSFDNGAAIQEQIQAAKSELSIENVKKIDIEKTMKKEEEMRGNLLQLARNLEVLKSKIPNDFKDTELSAIVNQAAQAAEIKISVLSRSSSSNSNRTAGNGSELVEEIVFSINAMGSFSQLLHFVEILSKEEKVIKTRNLQIEKMSMNTDDSTVRFAGEIIGFKQAAVAPVTTPPKTPPKAFK